MKRTPHIAVTGLDGSGKNTVADLAISERSMKLPQLKIGRPTEVVYEGQKEQVAKTMTNLTDKLHRITSDKGIKLAVAAVNGLEMVAKSRGLSRYTAWQNSTEAVWWVRDKVVDLAVYSGFYLERSKHVSTEQAVRLFRAISGKPADVIFYLSLDPEVAIERIDKRNEGMQARDMHETPEHLALIADRYSAVFDFAQKAYGTQVVEVDVNARTQAEAAEIVNHYTAVAFAGGVLPTTLV